MLLFDALVNQKAQLLFSCESLHLWDLQERHRMLHDLETHAIVGVNIYSEDKEC